MKKSSIYGILSIVLIVGMFFTGCASKNNASQLNTNVSNLPIHQMHASFVYDTRHVTHNILHRCDIRCHKLPEGSDILLKYYDIVLVNKLTIIIRVVLPIVGKKRSLHESYLYFPPDKAVYYCPHRDLYLALLYIYKNLYSSAYQLVFRLVFTYQPFSAI